MLPLSVFLLIVLFFFCIVGEGGVCIFLILGVEVVSVSMHALCSCHCWHLNSPIMGNGGQSRHAATALAVVPFPYHRHAASPGSLTAGCDVTGSVSASHWGQMNSWPWLAKKMTLWHQRHSWNRTFPKPSSPHRDVPICGFLLRFIGSVAQATFQVCVGTFDGCSFFHLFSPSAVYFRVCWVLPASHAKKDFKLYFYSLYHSFESWEWWG